MANRMRKMRFFLCIAALVFLCTGCRKDAEKIQDSPAQDKLLVTTSFYIMEDFTKKLAGDRAEVVSLIPAGVDAHDWEPSAKDITLLEKTDLLIVNGAGLEHWLDAVLPTLQNTALEVVDTSQDIALLKGVQHGNHVHLADPHIWLDPQNAALQMQTIYEALAKADPEGAADYKEHYEFYRARCEELDQTYQTAIAELPRREIIVAHEAFGYLCSRYGLHQLAIQGLSPEGEPDPARMAEMIRQAEAFDVRVIFFEEMASPKVAETIAREIGATTAVLSPIESLTEQQRQNGGDYFSVMQENLEQLKVALGA